ncbi:hypothetical protein [Desertihabitans aurantiacus]|uniref:hypothetical protein n=1 Tax=Desertihabitans aurantiacus TaxID=2282477 RepID=UPI001300828C|nr:hypothetical protein [Desertihabitans aurantiacus]
MSKTLVTPAKTYHRELAVAIAAYVVLLLIAVLALPALETSPWRWPLMVLPVLPGLGVAWALLRFIRRSDELQSRIVVESLAIGFALGSLATLGYGFLQLAGAPPLSWIFVWPVYGLSWAVGSLIARLRY